MTTYKTEGPKGVSDGQVKPDAFQNVADQIAVLEKTASLTAQQQKQLERLLDLQDLVRSMH